MNKFNHLIWASLFYMFFIMLFSDYLSIDGPTVFLGFLICLLYSLIPDLDLKSSWIKTQFNNFILYFLLIFIIFYFITTNPQILIGIVILIFIAVILQLLKHRTILHSPITGLVLATPLLFISYPNYVYFMSGYIGFISHYIVDLF